MSDVTYRQVVYTLNYHTLQGKSMNYPSKITGFHTLGAIC
jgi:hypothetical protein